MLYGVRKGHNRYHFLKSQEQQNFLETEFLKHSKLSKKRIIKLASKLGLSEGQIYKWQWDYIEKQHERYDSARQGDYKNGAPIFKIVKIPCLNDYKLQKCNKCIQWG